MSEQDGKGMHKEFLQVDVYIWDGQLRVALSMIHILKSWFQEPCQQGKHPCTRPHVPVVLQRDQGLQDLILCLISVFVPI